MYLPVDSNGDFLEDENGSLLLDPSTWEPYTISDSNFDNVPDGLQMMEQSSPANDPIQIEKLEAHVWTPGASLMEDPLTGVLKPVLVPGESLSDPDRLKFVEVFNGVLGGVRPVDEDLMIGNYVLGSIHGFKYADIDANGVYNPVDGTHENWDVPFEWALFGLYEADGVTPVLDGNGQPVTAMSNLDGEFWMTGVAPGDYVLIELLDQIDRNDMNGNGFPDGNGTPDVQEGLMASTPTEVPLTILSRQELVWTEGAANLAEGTVFSLDPDDLLGVPNGTDITTIFPNVTLARIRTVRCSR